jgi:dienelactone hydrolase
MARLIALLLSALAFCGPAAATVIATEVGFKDGDTQLTGLLAYDDSVKGKRPGVLLIHEFWGLTQHTRDFARDLAAHGYTALAVDMYGQVGETRDAAAGLMNALMGKPDVVKARFDGWRKLLASQPTVDPKRIAAIGFSMGGRIVLNQARAGDDLAAVASFYGNLETKAPARPGAVKARVLILNADSDPFVKPESVPAFKAEMEAAKVRYRYVSYPAKHAFSNPEATANGQKFNMPIAYDAETARKAKDELYRFLAEAFKR